VTRCFRRRTIHGRISIAIWLVRPADLTAAEQVLRDLGYQQAFDEREMPDWWREHSATWTRAADGTKVGSPSGLVGVGVDSEQLWLTLSNHTETLVVGEYPPPALTIPGRAFHLRFMQGQHGADWGRPQERPGARGISIADEASWSAAAELAASLEATAAFAAGLRLIPQGAALSERLGLPREVSVDVALRAGNPPPVALGLDQLAQSGRLPLPAGDPVAQAGAAAELHEALVAPGTAGPVGLVSLRVAASLAVGAAPGRLRAWRRARRSRGRATLGVIGPPQGKPGTANSSSASSDDARARPVALA